MCHSQSGLGVKFKKLAEYLQKSLPLKYSIEKRRKIDEITFWKEDPISESIKKVEVKEPEKVEVEEK